jgi:hypothetical protein
MRTLKTCMHKNTLLCAGVYSIDVKLYLRIRFKVGKVKIGRVRVLLEMQRKRKKEMEILNNIEITEHFERLKLSNHDYNSSSLPLPFL